MCTNYTLRHISTNNTSTLITQRALASNLSVFSMRVTSDVCHIGHNKMELRNVQQNVRSHSSMYFIHNNSMELLERSLLNYEN